MPLKVNVGLTRKVGEQNYGSRGASVNVELELDGSLVNEPSKLKEKIAQAFSLVRTSLDAELNGGNGNGNGNGHASANGKSYGTVQPAAASTKGRPATLSQVRAIQSICRDKEINLAGFLGGYGVSRAEDLSVKQASDIIDRLKQ